MEHDEQAQELEREAERMEHDADRLDDRIDATKRDWEAKEQDPSVPGARPEEDDEARGGRRVTETPREESDQLPEEGPPGQVPDDAGGDGSARDEAQESPGVPGEDETATGNPDAAGADEE